MSEQIVKWIDESALQQFDSQEIITATIKQICKDFALQGIELGLNSDASNVINSLAAELEELDFAHNPKLTPVLYQLDLNERKIAKKLTSTQPGSWYQALALEIVRRCFEKVAWRYRLKS